MLIDVLLQSAFSSHANPRLVKCTNGGLQFASGDLISLPLSAYCIVQNFDGGNFDVFEAFELDRQNLTHQIVLKTVQPLQVYGEGSNHPPKYFPSNI